MKKMICMILTVLMMAGALPISASDVLISTLTKIGPIPAKKTDWYLRYRAKDGNPVSIQAAISEAELEYLANIFSDQGLVCQNAELPEESIAAYPEYNSDDLYTFSYRDENYTGYDFRFDREKVVAFQISAADYTMKQGLFSFRDPDVYDELLTFIEENTAEEKKIQEEKLIQSRKNPVDISDFQILYQVSFPRPDSTREPMICGVCSYVKEGKKVTSTFYNIDYGNELSAVALATEPVNNTFETRSDRVVMWENGGKTGIEYDYPKSAELAMDITFFILPDEKGKAKRISATLDYKTIDKTEYFEADMSQSTQSGTLPSDWFRTDAEEKKEHVVDKNDPSTWEMIDGVVKLSKRIEDEENGVTPGTFDKEIFDVNTAIPEILWECDTKTPINIFVYTRNICYERYSSQNEWIPNKDIEKYIKGLSRFTLTKTTEDAYPETFKRHAYLEVDKHYYNPDEVFWRSYGLSILMRDDVVQINCNPDADGSGATYTVDDPDGFFAYLHEAFPEKPREPTRPSAAPDYLNQPYYIPGQEEENGIPVVDKMEFDVVVDDSYYDTVIEELADPGDTIHCTVLQARGGSYFFYLILEGPKKTRKSYFQTTKFDRQRDPRFTFGSIEIFGKATGGDIKNVELRFRSAGTDRIIGEWGKDYYLEKPNPLPAKNFEYELYVNTSMTMYRYLFNEVPEDTGEVELQDPTRYKIDLRADYGKNKWDFDINLATKFNIDTSGFKAPRWAEKIGADEKAEVTFLNIASYANGKYHLDNPAINIKGDKGDTWFWLNSAELRPDNAFVKPSLIDRKTVLLHLGSCISFDGFTVIRNLEEYDSLSVRFVFTDDDKTELDYIEIDFGGNKTVKTDAKKINYIGDSKAVYEHWIGGEGL